MSWVKKVWNRMFADEVEEEVEQEYTAPVEQKSAHVPFRFPLITDEEREIFLRKEQSGQQVTMAEVREELIRRPLQPAEQPLRREPRREPTPIQRQVSRPPIQRQPQISKPVPEASRPEPIKRRFEPTQVPSPIHGFNEPKPASIEKLLEQKERKEEFQKAISPVQENQDENVKAEQAAELGAVPTETVPTEEVPAEIASRSAITENSQEEQEEQEEQLLTETQVQEEEQKPEPVLVEEQDSSQVEDHELPRDEAVSAETLPEQPIEESPAVPPVNDVKSAPMDLKEKQPLHKEQQEEKNNVPVIGTAENKKEKTVPFNVLMLKSDKEKSKNRNPIPMKQQPAAISQKPKQEAVQVMKAEEPAAPSVQEPNEKRTVSAYGHPHKNFLLAPENDRKDEEWMEEQGERLTEALSHFQVQATILSIVQGPAVTQFELTVAQGVKVSKIRNLADDLKLALAAKDIRIQAPIPGKSSIGIEIPNRTSRPVRISEVIESPQFQDSDSPLEAALGLDLTGKPVTLDLRKMPHGLIAGATGSGKSVCINSILVSLLYKSSPQDLKLLLIDPKMVELAPYNHIPHLVSPVITDVKAATASLKWAVSEMERRYQLFAHTGVRDISRYNKMVKEKGDHAQHLPYILIVIDELADLMMMSPQDVEDAICRIAQKARACGIHLVIATQRPSVDVITGLIKSNIPTRIAFSVSSQVDSRTILDSQGAERLLGRGDMLYLGNGMSAPSRIQGTFVTDEEIEKIIEHVRSQGEPEYFFKEDELIKQNASGSEQDDLFEEACRFIMQQGSASTSLLQRKFHIGYNRAARLMDLIEEHGFISEQNGSKARSVLITEDDMSEVFQ
ncbi:DNA translocase FtsK [Planomicrobium sp. Y74]|uniref:DNA translocase FtsK n=1 Tax=Planomicrobium sp. Y74 TaxID=2478977 RepID=UPI000EF46652|nr:DNA translocase FtsK [Planomicrobium sp. Y74]RLQ91846.1 DNA translocase FtsK [Planomicrobium sp. Y74]